MSIICIMKDCPHRKHIYNNVNCFPIPIAYEMRQRWLQLCGAEYVDLTNIFPVVCAEHFEPQYVFSDGNTLCLHPDALPTPIESSTVQSIPMEEFEELLEDDIQQQHTIEGVPITEVMLLTSIPEESTIAVANDVNDIPIEEFLTFGQNELQSSNTSHLDDLEPADYFDVRCGEVFLSYDGVLEFHCSPCEKECGNFQSFVQHLKAVHYSQLQEDLIFTPSEPEQQNANDESNDSSQELNEPEQQNDNDSDESSQELNEHEQQNDNDSDESSQELNEHEQQSANDSLESSHELNDSISVKRIDIKQEEDSVNEFVDVVGKPPVVVNAANPLNYIEQVLIEEPARGTDGGVQIDFENEEKADELCDVLSVSEEKCDENIKSIAEAKNTTNSEVTDLRGRKACEICGKILRNNQVLKRHHETAHSLSQTCKCEICGLKLKHHSYLKSHMLRHTGEKNIPCDVCSKTFYTVSEKRLHLRSHGLTYVRPKPKPRKERQKIQESAYCELCDKTFKTKQTLRQHRVVVHPKSESSCCCEICGITLKHINYKRAHMLRHREKNVCCDLCSKRFYTLSEQRLHMRTHCSKNNGEENADESMSDIKFDIEAIVCNICHKSFKTKNSLKKHEIVHKETERKYKCTICGKLVLRLQHLKNHMARHTQEKTISCEICPKKFFTHAEHKLHLRWHTGEKPFVCSSCGMGFTNSSALTVHERKHRTEPPFRCEICNRGFYTNYRLRGHMIVHTKEKPFSCPICSTRFPRKRSMLRHIELRHKKKPKNNENEEELSVV